MLIRTDTGYAFRHALLRAAVLERVAEARHRALHRQAARRCRICSDRPRGSATTWCGAGTGRPPCPGCCGPPKRRRRWAPTRDALDTLAAVRDQAQGADLARLLGLRADLLMAGADAGAVDAYREALAVTTDPSLRVAAAGAAWPGRRALPVTWTPRRSRWTG